eukprot:3483825-Prymnesium_polylepis.1
MVRRLIEASIEAASGQASGEVCGQAPELVLGRWVATCMLRVATCMLNSIVDARRDATSARGRDPSAQAGESH